MSIETLREWLLNHPSFKKQMDAVVSSGVLNEFPSIIPARSIPKHDWSYLLLCASTLARSELADEQRVALRIADTCLKLDVTTQGEKVAAAVILDTMANKRSVTLATERHLVPLDLEKSLPLPLRADFLKRSSEDRILTIDGLSHPVNRFQVDFWEALSKSGWVSASAPTSAGKSFLLRLWVAEVFRKKKTAFVVFVVPTRALIQEFSNSFGNDLADGVLKDVTIHSLPLDGDFAANTGHLFIFTQERLHILLSRQLDLTFDLLIVDEAQKVGDGYRGVLLEQVISECVCRSQSTQVVYASPFVENPAYLMRGVPAGVVTKPVEREVTTVTQNLLFVSQERGDPKTWNVTYVAGEEVVFIGRTELSFRATSETKRLSTVAFAMQSPKGGNLIYANGASAAEKFAQHISEGFRSQEERSLQDNPRIADLIKLVRKTIHPKYLLVDTLKQGVAFHYGNMPLLIRTEIEALFRDNILRFLVCTATLIEGVNLPCKVIFMRGPTKGSGKSMPKADFWNLAGRAGRWGQEFHGTIVCIDPNKLNVWKEPPPTRRVKQHIKASTEYTLESAEDLLTYIQNDYPIEIGQKHPEYDYTLTFLLQAVMQGRFADLPSVRILTPDQRERLEVRLRAEIENFPLPHDFVFRHPGILPHAMKKLLNRFKEMETDALVAISPVLPESDDAVKRYLAAYAFINEHLRANWAVVGERGDKRLWQLAIMSVDWMRGKPLSFLIDKREKINQSRLEQKKLSAIIIEVMKDVEEFARFKIPKFLRAFLDVLYFHARQADITGVIRELPNLELWLELGVSVQTQLSLMELGLSRTSAIEVFELMMNDRMDKGATHAWLKNADPATLINLPELVKKEITRVLERYQQTPG